MKKIGMTGADVKRQVMDALILVQRTASSHALVTQHAKAKDALAPCVVLTREEADSILRRLSFSPVNVPASVRALLSPDEAGDE